MDDMAAIKLFKNALCFIMGYLVAMEMRVTLFLLVDFFCMIHSISPINVCTDFEISRYKIDEFRKHAKIVFYLTSRDAKTVRRTSWRLGILLGINMTFLLLTKTSHLPPPPWTTCICLQ